MMISAFQPWILGIVLPIVIVQYAFALFCLLKLAFFEADTKHYVLWNVFILIVFFIGGAVFLVYYYKHPEKHLSKDGEKTEKKDEQEQPDTEKSEEQTEPEQTEPEQTEEATEKVEEKTETDEQN